MIIVGLAFGTMEICNTDYLEVYDAFLGVNDALDSRRLITRFCGSVSIFLNQEFQCLLGNYFWHLAVNR